jgi:uncharacterized RDD family membrane protein YckC
LIDAIILLSLFLGMSVLFGGGYKTIDNDGTTFSGYQLTGLPGLAYMFFWFLLIPLLEGLTGQTVGKKLLRIQVLRQNGDSIGVGLSFVRHLFDCVDSFCLIGLIIAATNAKKARIGDLVAGTYVVDKNR